MNPLNELGRYGQSIWLDYIRRDLITGGGLKRMVEEDGLRGVTSNPAIFQKAITGSTDYADLLEKLRPRKDLDPMAIYEQLAIRDIKDAADVLRPVYEKTGGGDGYVSLEVSPYLAGETKRTIEEARRLFQAVGRENLMIKVPATPEGIPAIEQLISEGINVNVTLIFSRDTYEDVAQAYITGLERLSETRSGDIGRVGSVASFFVSRIDAAIETAVEARLEAGPSPDEVRVLKSLPGRVAIANARLAYRRYREIFRGDRWEALAAKGARTQRLLWASTGTKNPRYSDVLYVDELIGQDTVNTLPPATYEAFRDHGRARASLEEGEEEARETMDSLGQAGISMKQISGSLLDDGVRLFSEAFDKLLDAVDVRCTEARKARVNTQDYSLPDSLGASVTATLDTWRVSGKVRRLFGRDPSVWTGTDEGNWLGWLGITGDQLANGGRFEDIAEDVKTGKFSHLLLLGMGGSSLCPEVLRRTFGTITGYPELHVLDSTDPAQIRSFEDRVDPANTLFIVSSKSGSTLEPNILKSYFYELVEKAVGADKAGERFIAITDPGSHLERAARDDRFRRIFYGVPSIGGRFSALSDFGMVPGAAMGVDVREFLARSDEMALACSSCIPPRENPGVVLGTILGVLGNRGKDKVTIITSPGIRGFGAWLEQLLAESTGKDGKALIPVDGEALGPPAAYGEDRLFVYLRLEGGAEESLDRGVKELEESGHPVVRIAIPDLYSLGQEFFRWEMATAVAGSILGINPFNQPDVEASKVATRELTDSFEREGALPAEEPILVEGGIKLFTGQSNAAEITRLSGGDPSMEGFIRGHLSRIGPGDYFGLLAYIEMNEAKESALQRIRLAVRDQRRVATCLGFGPRFLHSTGQAYKGGPNTGVFLQITCDDLNDLSVPGRKYSFGIVKAAQARGDFQVLSERDRRVLRIHLPAKPSKALDELEAAVRRALK